MENRRSRRKAERENRKANGQQDVRKSEDIDHHPITKTFKHFTLKAKNDEQRKYINSIKNFALTVGAGTMGSGKTFIPAVIAAQMLQEGLIEKIYVVRPNVELGRPIGFLKGSLYEKMSPWLQPVMDGLEAVMEPSFIKYLVEKEVIQAVPISYLRGRTFSNCFVIFDESQNSEYEEMKCFTQRIGEYSKIVITGDVKQKDIKTKSGLESLLRIHEMYERKPMNIIELTECVRSDVASFFLDAYEELETTQSKETI